VLGGCAETHRRRRGGCEVGGLQVCGMRGWQRGGQRGEGELACSQVWWEEGSARMLTMPFQQVNTGAGSSAITARNPLSSRKYGHSVDAIRPNRSRMT
jgi:hypothetical protein